MAKTRRQIKEMLPLVDGVVELLDARVPYSSANPELDTLVRGKPRIVLLNKCDVADPAATKRWIAAFEAQGKTALAVDCRSGKGLSAFLPTVQQVLKKTIEKNTQRGMAGKPLRLMVVGIPNTGKSSFINRMAGKNRAKVADKAGVTRQNQWFAVGGGIELLDTPGAPLFQLVDRAALVELLQARTETPWYGQLMTVPQAIAYFLQVNHWPEHYRIRLG